MSHSAPTQPSGPPQTRITPAGENDQAQQAALGLARTLPGFREAAGLFTDMLRLGVELATIDVGPQGVLTRLFVDGAWLDLPPRPRELAEPMLPVFKIFAGVNFPEPRPQIEGQFTAKHGLIEFKCKLLGRWGPHGEQLGLQLTRKKPAFDTLADLGMRDKMVEQLRGALRTPGLFVFAAPPKQGLTTLWRVGLSAADRFLKHFVSVQDAAFDEPEVINIEPRKFNKAAGETPATALPKILLQQPDVLVVPDVVDAASLERLCDLALDGGVEVILRVAARDAVEALSLVAAALPDPAKFYRALGGVLCQRLVRKLCVACRQPYPPPPELLRQLGIPPGRVQSLYNPGVPMLVEPTGKNKGGPPIVQACRECLGSGYRGRTGIFELLLVDDRLRPLLGKPTDPNALRQAARQLGCRPFAQEASLLVALGTTSLAEAQRALA